MLEEDPRHEEEEPLTKEQEDLDAQAEAQAEERTLIDDDCEPGHPVGRGKSPWEAISDLRDDLQAMEGRHE